MAITSSVLICSGYCLINIAWGNSFCIQSIHLTIHQPWMGRNIIACSNKEQGACQQLWAVILHILEVFLFFLVKALSYLNLLSRIRDLQPHLTTICWIEATIFSHVLPFQGTDKAAISPSFLMTEIADGSKLQTGAGLDETHNSPPFGCAKI